MKNDILVSIVMPAYNAEGYIAKAITSVQKQTYQVWELFVIDDCSQDRTRSIVMEFSGKDKRIHCYTLDRNVGVAKARNYGVNLCNGQYIAFLDSDDLWESTKLERQLQLAVSSDADLLYSAYTIIDSTDKILTTYSVPQTIHYSDLLRENVIGCSTVLLKTSVMQKFTFDSQYHHEDYLLWLQIVRAGYCALGINEPLTHWRMMQHSRSSNKLRCAYYRWQILRTCLQLPITKCMLYFACYVHNSLKKYRNI